MTLAELGEVSFVSTIGRHRFFGNSSEIKHTLLNVDSSVQQSAPGVTMPLNEEDS